VNDPTLAGFSTNYRACKAQMGVMTVKALEMLAIGRAPYTPFENDSAWWRSVLGKRSQIVSQFQVCLDLKSDLDESHRTRLVSMLNGAMKEIGVAATAGGGCRGRTVLAIDCHMTCKQGHLGPVCQLDMNGTISNTATGEKLAEIPFGEMFKGAHGNDPEKAKKKACEAVTQDKIKAALSSAFSAVLPVD
jgi:hypothetical protein